MESQASGEAKAFGDIKFQEVEAMVRQYREERDEAEAAQKVADDLAKKMRNTESRILSFMAEFGLKSHKTVYGTCIRAVRETVTTPKGEDKTKFRAWLEEKGYFDDLWTVHSQSLNSRYKEWFQNAVDAGDVDFKIPGIGEPSISEYMQFRRK